MREGHLGDVVAGSLFCRLYEIATDLRLHCHEWVGCTAASPFVVDAPNAVRLHLSVSNVGKQQYRFLVEADDGTTPLYTGERTRRQHERRAVRLRFQLFNQPHFTALRYPVPMLRTVRAVRYVLPLREGGSVPALVEADDLGLYVVKLRGASQGALALVAELVSGELARAAQLLVPELVLVDLDAKLAESEPDPELADPLEASAGLNLGLDFLPGSIGFDGATRRAPDAVTASRAVLFDALVLNVDRTARNPNLLVWHGRTWLIDHGASLYLHHGWAPDTVLEGADDPFDQVKDHVLLRWATALAEAAVHLRACYTEATLARVVDAIPDEWLGAAHGFDDASAHRAAYMTWLAARLAALPQILAEAHRAHAALL